MRSDGGYSDAPIVAEMYDHSPIYARRSDTGFYVEEATARGERVLELGCGTGRVLIPTARAGATVCSVDLSEHMLARCREKLASEPQEVRERVRLVAGSITDVELGETFDVATIPFRPLQHLATVAEQLAALGVAHRHLRPGGTLIFDVFHPDPTKLRGKAPTEEQVDVPEIPLPDGRRFKRTHIVTRFRPAEQVNDVQLIYYVTHPDGASERHVQAFPFRYFYRYEVEHLLARTGFEVETIYGDYDRSPLGGTSPEMIFVARKLQMA